jgi:hypothetical protein
MMAFGVVCQVNPPKQGFLLEMTAICGKECGHHHPAL